MELSETHQELLESKTVAHLATMLPDESPHSVPVWVGYDGSHVLTAGGQEHQRHANIERNPRVSLSVVDSNDPYRSVSIRGEVVEMAENGALEFLDRKARQHWGTSRSICTTAGKTDTSSKSNRRISSTLVRYAPPARSDDD